MKKIFKNKKNRVLLFYSLVFMVVFGIMILNNIIQKGINEKNKKEISNNTSTITAMINEESLTVKGNQSIKDETITVSDNNDEDMILEPITVYTSTNVNLRWSPKIKENNVIVTLDKYTELKVFNQVYFDNWYQVCGGEYDELYVNKDYILTEEEYNDIKISEEPEQIINRGGKPISSATYQFNDDINEYFSVYSYSGYSLDYIENKISEKYPDILPIVQQAWNIEQEYGINLRFTLAVACHETGLGKYLSNRNNYFGLRKSHFMTFDNPSDSVNTFAETIINLSKTYGNTLIELKPIYCPNGDTWTNEVIYFIKNI